MPEPFFSNNAPGQDWLQNVNEWYKNRDEPLYKPEKYGLLTGTPDERIRDQEMMDLILMALLGGPSGPGVDTYRFAPKKSGKKDDVSLGVEAINEPRDPVSAADKLIRGY